MFIRFLFLDEDLFSPAYINSSDILGLGETGWCPTPTGCHHCCLFLASPQALCVNLGEDEGTRLRAGVFEKVGGEQGSRVPTERTEEADSQLCGTPPAPLPTPLPALGYHQVITAIERHEQILAFGPFV